MLKRISSALVPVKNTFDRLTMQSTATKKKPTDFDLVKNEDHFETSNEVVRFLPDILGRALARSWLVLQLYYVEELNVYEVAAILGLTTGRISQIKKSALEHAHKSMLEQMK
jgi:RNA polymerase sigma factor (sigma-70 family)